MYIVSPNFPYGEKEASTGWWLGVDILADRERHTEHEAQNCQPRN
jgi:hypothetical protein